MDADGSGEIDFEEFLIIMARDKKNTDPMDEAMKIFNMFDKDGSGAIDAEGMRVRACTNVCMCTYVWPRAIADLDDASHESAFLII